MRVRSLAGHARRPDGASIKTLPNRHGHQEAKGSQGLPPRFGKLSRQAVIARRHLCCSLIFFHRLLRNLIFVIIQSVYSLFFTSGGKLLSLQRFRSLI